MRDLGYWWPFARTAWGWLVATAGGIAALFYGPKKAVETFDWYMDRFFDYKVREYLEGLVEPMAYMSPNGRGQSAKSATVSEIAIAINMSERKVRKCLTRLRRKKIVILERNGRWKLDIPPFSSF